MPRMLDLFSGRWGWSKAFAARGWECVGVDLTIPPEIPARCEFIQADVLTLTTEFVRQFDFVCASSPCEEFSVHGMKMFHANPPHPVTGLKLFEHTREICEVSGVPYVMENVRATQQFVGESQHNCGPFHLWGTGVPLLLPQGCKKGQTFHGMPGALRTKVLKSGGNLRDARNAWKRESCRQAGGASKVAANAAVIPSILANCVADYAERLLEARHPVLR